MLEQRFRNVLVATVQGVIPNWQDFRTLVNSVRNGSWEASHEINSTYPNTLTRLVEVADGAGWLRDLVQHFAAMPNARPDFGVVLAEIDRVTTPQTVANPFDEVLLDGDRPFINRRPLRSHLLNLTSERGARVLLVNGKPQTGKSFSFYFINHVAPTKGFAVHKFRMGSLQKPDQLTLDILGRIGVKEPIPPIGQESAERWAERLADVVSRVIREQRTPRLFLFDEFSETPLPEGTLSLIVRLAADTDSELKTFLRLVLVRFPGVLPMDVADIALIDDAEPFTNTDMAAAVMQVVAARKLKVTPRVVMAKIRKYHQGQERSLNDRFKFMRGLLQQL